MTGASPLTPLRSPTGFEGGASAFALTLWTNDPRVARAADLAGVDRIGVDLERFGKSRRQHGRGTWISSHTYADIRRIRGSLSRAQLFARTDPLTDHSPDQVGRLLAEGVEVLMLPMYERGEEVARFADIVDGRASLVPLLETRSAAEQISQLASLGVVNELHIGINDLAISLGARMRFDVLFSPLVERVAETASDAGVRLGIGAIGRLSHPALPISASLLYARYVELGAEAALLARTYVDGIDVERELAVEIGRSRHELAWWRAADAGSRERARTALRAAINAREQW
jgi:hypothetical protein